ncbi:MAG: hypothetical protein ACTHLO_05020 [Pseudolabrys sp.]
MAGISTPSRWTIKTFPQSLCQRLDEGARGPLGSPPAAWGSHKNSGRRDVSTMWLSLRRAISAAGFGRLGAHLALACMAALLVAGCQTEKEASLAAAEPRGASVAFESIDGLPQDRFHTLVQDLNGEAQLRRLAVVSREHPTAYRVRGYFSAAVERGRTTISWVWDVFDTQERRATRISGAEESKSGKAWAAADDAMLQRIARSSMEQLAAFLAAPDATPETPVASAETPRLALTTDAGTPEAAGIFRVSQAAADPVSAPVPVPRRRQAMAASAAR